MRNYIIYLIMIVFVGGHVVSDIFHHYNDGVEITTSADKALFKGGNNFAKADFAQLVKTSMRSDYSGNSDTSQNLSNHMHCVAHCGLAASGFTAFHPGPRQYRAPPNDISTVLNTANDLFRPPIS